MKIKTDYVPRYCDYLTAGKEYEVRHGSEFGGSIIDDKGEEQFVHFAKSGHLNFEPWTVINE